MECRKCREHIPDGRVFCPNCGLQVDKMDEYVGKSYLSMSGYKYDIGHGLYERAFTSFGLAAVAFFGTLYMIATGEWAQRPAATFCVSIVMCVMCVVEGVLLIDVRDRMEAFRSDAPGYLVKLDIVFGAVSTVWLLLMVLLNSEYFGDEMKWWLLGTGVWALLCALLTAAEYSYYRDRIRMFNK